MAESFQSSFITICAETYFFTIIEVSNLPSVLHQRCFSFQPKNKRRTKEKEKEKPHIKSIIKVGNRPKSVKVFTQKLSLVPQKSQHSTGRLNQILQQGRIETTKARIFFYRLPGLVRKVKTTQQFELTGSLTIRCSVGLTRPSMV